MVGKIKGTGSYRPVQVWDNDKLSHMMDTSDEWIRGSNRNRSKTYCKRWRDRCLYGSS